MAPCPSVGQPPGAPWASKLPAGETQAFVRAAPCLNCPSPWAFFPHRAVDLRAPPSPNARLANPVSVWPPGNLKLQMSPTFLAYTAKLPLKDFEKEQSSAVGNRYREIGLG